MKTRSLAWMAATAIAFAHIGVAAAAEPAFPDGKPIRLVVGAPPGGSTDLVAREVAQGLGTLLGTQVFIDNKPGAGTTLAAGVVSKLPPDGYTLLLGTVSSHAVAPSVFANLRYDPVKDFTAITPVATIPNVVVVNPQVPAKTLAELIALARKNPDKYTYASNGVGASNGLATAQLAALAGVKMVNVPYKGAAPALIDLVGGQIDLMLDVVMTSETYVSSGKLRALAVTSAQRSALLPNVPTVAEQGFPGYEATVWFGMFGPPNMAPALTAKLNKAIIDVVHSPRMVKFLESQGAVPTTMTPPQFSAFIGAEVKKWAGAAKAAGVTPE